CLRHRDGVVEAGATGFPLRGRPLIEHGERRHAMSKRRRDPRGEPVARRAAQDEGVAAGAGLRLGCFGQPNLLVHRRRAARGMSIGANEAPDPRTHNLERHLCFSSARILAVYFRPSAVDCRLSMLLCEAASSLRCEARAVDFASYSPCIRRANAISDLIACTARRDSRIKSRHAKKSTSVPAKPSAVGIHATELARNARPIAIVVPTKAASAR